MKIGKQIALCLLLLGMLYFGVLNHKYPYVILAEFALFGFLIFVWGLLPMLKSKNIIRSLKGVAFFTQYRIPKLLLFTFLIYISIIGTEIGGKDHGLQVLFWILKIAVAVFLELIVAVYILLEDVDLSSGCK